MNLTWTQAKAIGRHVASYAAGAVTVLVGVGLFSQGQGAELTDSIGHVTAGISELLKGVAGIVAVLTPIYTALRASHAASPNSQARSVAANLTAVTNGSRLAVINAVGEMPEVRRVLVPSEVAQATPSPKVVAAA